MTYDKNYAALTHAEGGLRQTGRHPTERAAAHRVPPDAV